MRRCTLYFIDQRWRSCGNMWCSWGWNTLCCRFIDFWIVQMHICNMHIFGLLSCMCWDYIVASNGVVLATEKKQKSILYDENSIHKIEMITKNVGMVYSGMGPDYRYTYSTYVQQSTAIKLTIPAYTYLNNICDNGVPWYKLYNVGSDYRYTYLDPFSKGHSDKTIHAY